MHSSESNRFFTLVEKEHYAKKDAFEWLRNSLVSVSAGLTCLAIAHSEGFTGMSHEFASTSERIAYFGMWAGIGSVAITGVNAVRYWTVADKVQQAQAQQFVPIMHSELGRELQVLEDFIVTEHREYPTED